MKLRSIQFLRAIAVLLVIYMHSLGFQPRAGQQHFFFLPHFGAIGVDIFFIISGFIITYSAGRYLGRREGLKFLFNRFLRLVPIYWLATLVHIGALLCRGFSIHPSLSLITNTLLLLPLADARSFTGPILSVAWTLSFEWLFYFLFFGSIILSIRRKAFFLSGLLIALVIAGWVFHPADIRMIFLTNPVLLEFTLGIGLYWCHQKIKVTRTVAWFLLLTGVILYGCEIFWDFGEIWRMENTVSGRLSFTRFLLWGIPSASLVAGCIFLESNDTGKRIWNHRLFSLIGDASYSIYLTHLSFYLLCTVAYTRMGLSLNPDLAVILQCFGAVIGGILFYKVAEAPLLQKMKSAYSASIRLAR